jgi:hypothetical protein
MTTPDSVSTKTLREVVPGDLVAEFYGYRMYGLEMVKATVSQVSYDHVFIGGHAYSIITGRKVGRPTWSTARIEVWDQRRHMQFLADSAALAAAGMLADTSKASPHETWLPRYEDSEAGREWIVVQRDERICTLPVANASVADSALRRVRLVAAVNELKHAGELALQLIEEVWPQGSVSAQAAEVRRALEHAIAKAEQG